MVIDQFAFSLAYVGFFSSAILAAIYLVAKN